MPGTAFLPANWSNACEFTLQQMPASDLTAFTHGIDVSRLSAAVKAAVQADAGDIRVTNGSNTELPFDLFEWAYNAGAPTGRIFVKADTSSSAALKVRVWAGYTPGTAVAYDANETYGSDNAYDQHTAIFWPSGGGTDRTKNNRDAIAEGGVTVGGATGNNGESATTFDGTDDQCTIASVPLSGVKSWEVPGGFTNTGIAYDPVNGTLWISDFTNNQLVETTLAGASTGTTISLTGGQPQGVAYDSSDDSFWVVSLTSGEIEHYSRAGSHLSADDIAFSNVNGVSYEAATDTLWISDNTSTVKRINKSGTVQESFAVTGLTNVDDLHYDAADDELFICDDDFAGTPTIIVVNAADGSVKRQIGVPDWIESCTLDDSGNLYFTCDATFHDTPLDGNRVFIAANRGRVSATLSLWLAGTPTLTPTDYVMGLGNAVTGDYGLALTLSTTTNARVFIAGQGVRVNTNKTISTGACKLTAVGRFNSGSMRVYQNGVEVGTADGTGATYPLDAADNTDDPFATQAYEFGVGNVPSGDTDRFIGMTASMARFSHAEREPVWDLQEYRWETDQASYWGTPADVGSGIAGSATITLGAATLSSSGAVANGPQGSAAITLDAATLSSAGSVANGPQGSAAITLDAATLSSSGAVADGPQGSAAITLGDVTLDSLGGTPAVIGSAAITLDAATLTATGTLADGIDGTAGITLAAVTLSGAGTVADGPQGSATITLDAATLSAAGTVQLSSLGDLDLTLDALTVTTAGTVETPESLPGMLKRGMTWLHSKRHSYFTTDVIYRTSLAGTTTEMNIKGTIGETQAGQLFETELIMSGTLRDFIFRTEDFISGSTFSAPLIMDEIEERDGTIWEVVEIGGEPCWRYSDPHRTAIRVHVAKLNASKL